jgi:hypothetical protein
MKCFRKISDDSFNSVIDNENQELGFVGQLDEQDRLSNGNVYVSSDELSPEEKEQILDANIRWKRDELLAACDWTQGNDSPLSVEDKALWATYRQALRDLPENLDLDAVDYISEIEWPTKPGEGA